MFESTSSQNPTWVFKQRGLEFDKMRCYTTETIRLYENAEGILFPSVTHALGDMKKATLDSWRQKVGIEAANKISKQAADRGTRVHKLAEDFLNNKPNFMRGAFPDALELFGKLKKNLMENVKEVYAQEFPLYSLDLSVAGRCDLYCNYDGYDSVVDFKTSSGAKKKEWITNYFYQATAYAMMLRERGHKADNFYILITSPDGLQVFDQYVDDWVEETRAYFKSYHIEHNYSQDYFRSLVNNREPDREE